jgi:uncharacterized protein (DUF2252 family)
VTPGEATAQLTRDERVALGKAARSKVPRSQHADWEAPVGRTDPVEMLLKGAEGSDQELVPIRFGRMLESPFTFFRGAASMMAADLATNASSGLTAQLCGDAHLSNFGGFASPDRRLVFDINDFDETLPGPWEWDLKRLAASIEVAGRDLGLSGKRRRAAVCSTAREYREAMRRFAEMSNLEVWYSRLDEAAILKRWGDRATAKTRTRAQKRMAKARSKDSLRAFARLTHVVDGERRIISDPPLISPIEEWMPKSDLPGADEQMRDLLGSYRRTLSGGARHLIDGYRYVHVARKVVGVGSVGTRALIVLLLGVDDRDPLFLQVKEATRSALEPHLKKSRFRAHGQRVIEGQWLIQAASDSFLGWLTATGVDGVKRDFYVRQLWDWKLSAEIEGMGPSDLAAYGEICGWTLARAHARSSDRVALASYIGGGDAIDRALADFARKYADQNERDYEALDAAARSGRVAAEKGV